MRSIKRGLAILLAVLLIIPTVPVSAEEPSVSPTTATDAGQPDAGNKPENPMDEDEKQPDAEKKEEDVIPKETPGSAPSNEDEGKNEVVSPKPVESPEATTETEGTATPEVTAVPEASDSPVPTSTPDAGASPEVSASPEAVASPEASATPEGTASPEVTAAPDASASPSASATPTASASPSATPLLDISEADEILFNTGNHAWSVVTKEAFDQEMGDAYYEADGSYTINIPEENPFFPYEVQFTCNGEVTNQWFMTPDDSVEIGGHTFYVSAYFDGTAVTQLSLNVAGDTVIVWPEEKEFTDEEDGGAAELSLLPLPEKSFTVRNALLGYTPAELTMVSIDSIFAGEAPLQSTDKVAWVYKGGDVDDYVISSSGNRIDLSCGIASGSSTWEMIVGDADQLNMSNTRYMVNIKTTPSRQWLKPTVYSENDIGSRAPVSVSSFSYYDGSRKSRSLDIEVPAEETGDKLYVNLEINPSVFGSTRSANYRIYEGQFFTAEEAMAGSDITSQICGADMAQQGAGYVLEKSGRQWLTMVTFDGGGQVTGCLPFYLYLYSGNVIRNRLDARLYEKGTYNSLSIPGYIEESPDECIYKTISRYSEHANRNYCMLTMTYYKAGIQNSTDITAAYEGQYGSISEAVSAGATDIKNSLFASIYSGGGYEADYSQGVYFTVFVGSDGSADQEVYHCNIKTEETKHTGTNVWFNGVNDKDGASIDSYVVRTSDDTYSRNRYYTILVEGNVDLTQLAPVFSTSSGVVLYAAGSSTPEISGVSIHDFSKGAVQYTAASEDEKSQENYWLQIVKAVNGVGRLYINSLADEESHTREENGIIYSTREVMLDSHYGKVHDILLANIGTAAIPAISAELSSDVVKLDDYWTLHGNQDLAAFTTTDKTSQSNEGELANLAKLRIIAKDGVEDGTDVTGTLTIKSAGNTLMVLTLTGTIGDPCITTKEIPEAVKYVPYGTMIQNSNKYSWNRVSYSMTDGALPGGMIVKPNGEIYGVPTESGEFTFTVEMTNSAFYSSSSKTYTLTVLENTDPNVDGATDTGYDLSQRVQNISFTSLDFSSSYNGNLELPAGNRTLVSQGIYGEFVDIYLDGIKLVKGTDYMSESGSTRITILTQTLVSRSAGTHTLGVEFRTSDTDELRRAAQNYVVNIVEDGNGSGTDENNGGNNGGGSDEGSGGDADSGSSDNNSNSNTSLTNTANGAGTGNAAGTEGAANTIAYTVESGDSLWKIARRFFGDGNFWRKIYAENAEVIGSDPNKLQVGMVLTIYLNQGDGSMITAVSADGAAGNSYTVQRGDTLWKIALKVYGRGWRWRRIYDANTDKISDPGQIYVGQVLFIPE